jgi:hypothetical protein
MIRLIIFYLILAIILLPLLYLFGRLLVKWSYKVQKRKDAAEFIQQLSYLDVCVNYGLISKSSTDFIIAKFNEIDNNPSKDPERIRELKNIFKERYAEFLQEASEY